jgi:hypothetical protein
MLSTLQLLRRLTPQEESKEDTMRKSGKPAFFIIYLPEYQSTRLAFSILTTPHLDRHYEGVPKVSLIGFFVINRTGISASCGIRGMVASRCALASSGRRTQAVR